MSIEDRLRDALQATAATVDEHRSQPLPQRAGRRRTSRRLTPLLAPLVILILIGGFIGARQWSDGPERPQRRAVTMPKFFLTVVGGSEDTRSRLQVVESESGRVLDTYKAPWGIDFQSITATAGDHTFLVTSMSLAGKPCLSSIQRVQVSGAGKIIGVVQDAGSIRGATYESGSITVTPDGRQLAYSAGTCGREENTEIGVIDLETGKRKVWKELGDGALGKPSWSSNGADLFFVRQLVNSYEVRVMDTSTSTEGSVTGQSALVWKTDRYQSVTGVLAIGDGSRILIAQFQGETGKQRQGTALLELVVKTRQVVRRVLSPRDLPHRSDLFQGDASGRFIILDDKLIDLGPPVVVKRNAGRVRYEADW